jgi:hypothetical protein
LVRLIANGLKNSAFSVSNKLNSAFDIQLCLMFED